MRRFCPLILELLSLVSCHEEVARRQPAKARSAPSSDAVLSVAPVPTAQPVRTAKARKVSLKKRLRRITRGRYMEGTCRKGAFRGWEGFPLKRCRYAVPDVTGHKSTEVIMLNPSAKRLARWIDSACDGDAACIDTLVERILWQSSAQFPVAGIVLEDIRPRDGHFEMYCFRDGVRVEVVGFETKSTARPTDDHVDSCLRGELIQPTSFARIAGTTPAQYLASGGREAVIEEGRPTAIWLDVTRTLYQAAWESSRNALIDAWVQTQP